MIIQEPITIDASNLSVYTKFLLSTGDIVTAIEIDSGDGTVYIENHGWRYLCWISGYWYQQERQKYLLEHLELFKDYMFFRKIDIKIIK